MGEAHGRRQFVGMLTGAVAGFTLSDPRPIATLASQLFTEKGAELMNLWSSSPP